LIESKLVEKEEKMGPTTVQVPRALWCGLREKTPRFVGSFLQDTPIFAGISCDLFLQPILGLSVSVSG
jgi:hypothetical protein